MSKLLTIAIPCYNVEKYLNKSLESYCDKRLVDDLEVVIVDDGSTDGTQRIARTFVERFPSMFRLVYQENGGHGAGVNTGLSLATGKYFRVVDGDDWIHADALLNVLDFMRTNDVDVICDVKQEVHMVTGEETLFLFPDSVVCNSVLRFADICRDAAIEPHLMIHNLSFNTNYLRGTGLSLLRHTFYEDWEYVVKGCVQAKTIAFLDENVYQYQVGNASQSVSAQSYANRYDHHTRVLETMMAFAENHRNAADLDPALQDYLDHKLGLLIDTHYNIALIFDADRKRGAKRAKEFRAWLKSNYPAFSRRGDKRYFPALALHHAGVDAVKLDKLMNRNARQ